jgi:hypothetical protein
MVEADGRRGRGVHESFGDAIEEINHRQIDLRQLAPRDLSSRERARAYADLLRGLVDLLSGKGA